MISTLPFVGNTIKKETLDLNRIKIKVKEGNFGPE